MSRTWFLNGCDKTILTLMKHSHSPLEYNSNKFNSIKIFDNFFNRIWTPQWKSHYKVPPLKSGTQLWLHSKFKSRLDLYSSKILWKWYSNSCVTSRLPSVFVSVNSPIINPFLNVNREMVEFLQLLIDGKIQQTFLISNN